MKLTTEDYQDAAERLRRILAVKDDAALRVFLSNNVNLLLGALDDAALQAAS